MFFCVPLCSSELGVHLSSARARFYSSGLVGVRQARSSWLVGVRSSGLLGVRRSSSGFAWARQGFMWVRACSLWARQCSLGWGRGGHWVRLGFAGVRLGLAGLGRLLLLSLFLASMHSSFFCARFCSSMSSAFFWVRRVSILLDSPMVAGVHLGSPPFASLCEGSFAGARF